MSVTASSHLTESQRESLEVAEAARETEWHHPSFAAELFLGRLRVDLVDPYPLQDPQDKAEGDAYLEKLQKFLKENLDPEAVDRTREVPQHVLKGLADLGAFAIKIPKEYGGLGLSQINYNRAVALVASYCGSTAVWLSAHQSIGVPQPLKLFGTEEQKKKYFPRFAKGEVSGFALTEPGVGSDPARMSTTAEKSPDGKYWILNGEKLWCTNGLVADVLVVMAKTPPPQGEAKKKSYITAFIVEGNSPGIERVHRCDFMGIRGIQNGVLRFNNVKVPVENVLWEEGKGLKLALVTLNTGRLTLPAASAAMVKQAVQIARQWGNERVQWGAPIGRHEEGAVKIARMAANAFAMEAMTYYASALVDRGGADIRLEAAMAKLFCSVKAWEAADDLVQLRGGRGFETAESLRARGEKGYSVERMLRDCRINRIIEGTDEIQHLFIAREALDFHMRLAGDLLNPKAPLRRKLKALLRCALFYPFWYLRLWLPTHLPPRFSSFKKTARHMRYIERAGRRLARALFHQMLRFGPKLERRQRILARLVEIGTELFAMSCACTKAKALRAKGAPEAEGAQTLADTFCRQARLRVEEAFRAICKNTDVFDRKVAESVLGGKFTWLEEGILPDDGAGFQGKKEPPSPSERRRYPT